MKDGGPAFPVVSVFVDASNTDDQSGTTISSERGGMTMRQYYKAAALTGILASYEKNRYTSETITNWPSEIADAMLAEDEEHDSR